MLFCLQDNTIHYERFKDGEIESIAVFLPCMGVDWQTWRAQAQRIRREVGEVNNSVLGGPVYVGGVRLRAEPMYLARRYSMHTYEPLVNVLVETESAWKQASQDALSACGVACVDSSAGRDYSHPETIAGPKGGYRDQPVREDEADPLNQLLGRINKRPQPERDRDSVRGNSIKRMTYTGNQTPGKKQDRMTDPAAHYRINTAGTKAPLD